MCGSSLSRQVPVPKRKKHNCSGYAESCRTSVAKSVFSVHFDGQYLHSPKSVSILQRAWGHRETAVCSLHGCSSISIAIDPCRPPRIISLKLVRTACALRQSGGPSQMHVQCKQQAAHMQSVQTQSELHTRPANEQSNHRKNSTVRWCERHSAFR